MPESFNPSDGNVRRFSKLFPLASHAPRHSRAETDGLMQRGKPPLHSRFQKGTPATPGGRPSGMTPGRITNLALKQAFRRVTAREGGKVFRITTFEAVIRAGGERQK